MRKAIVITIITFIYFSSWAQDYSVNWEGHFSYYNVKKVVEGNNKIYAATENAIFSYDSQSNTIETITTINGLSGQTISTMAYSQNYELLVIGYINGLMEIKFDNDDNVLSIIDILEKPTILPNNRKINHFNIQDNLVYISTDYGISVYDLARLEFGDTYYIGNNGEQIQVSQTAILDNVIYASCLGNNGIKKANITNTNIIDFGNWQTITTGNFTAIETATDQLYTVSSNRIYRINNDSLSELFAYANNLVELKFDGEYLIVVTPNDVYIYNSGFTVISHIPNSGEFVSNYTSATLDSDFVYVGTDNFGVLRTLVSNPIVFEEIRPEGPLLNNPFSIEAIPNELWVSFGEYDLFLNPYPLNSRGLSHLTGDEWTNIPFDEVLGARNLNDIAVNPNNKEHVFISSFIDGLLEIQEEMPIFLHTKDNSALEALILPGNPSYDYDTRTGPVEFDGNGLLWTVTSRINEPLKSYNPISNNWQSYSFTDVIPDGFENEVGYRDLVIGTDNTKWVAGYRNGVVAYNESRTSQNIKLLRDEENNLPSNYITALAMDKRNQLWIGTFSGLRVLYNTTGFFDNDNVSASEIIILQDGEASELLFQQHVTDIKVDGSNNKWVGTANSGIFYFSSDGQETIFHFTTDNSPLPSNLINDISIDDANGIVYMATDKGLVAFKAGGSSPFEDLENAYAYPNPVRPKFDIVEQKVKIKDISENVNIKITDIEGNLVAEAQSRKNQRYSGYNLEIDGGTAYWNGKNLANNVVASGVYLIMLSDLDTFETKVLKLMVVR